MEKRAVKPNNLLMDNCLFRLYFFTSALRQNRSGHASGSIQMETEARRPVDRAPKRVSGGGGNGAVRNGPESRFRPGCEGHCSVLPDQGSSVPPCRCSVAAAAAA
ncbi:hypothetical protein SAY87_017104 [Trapa incisa]|uniref:Uncharacterized protein n=1 Tax=Trapa incisa TaxID=236973 RepID=A0AAN7LDI8_9MYRT|nr:hypothetical protein SAY87_017104 [Trapa incisa]